MAELGTPTKRREFMGNSVPDMSSMSRCDKLMQIGNWQRSLREFMQQDARLSDLVSLYGQKFVQVGENKNFTLSTLTDMAWTVLVLTWEAILENKLPLVDKVEHGFQKRYQDLREQFNKCRADWLQEVSNMRDQKRSKQWNASMQSAFESAVQQDVYSFIPEQALDEQTKQYFDAAIKEKLKMTLMKEVAAETNAEIMGQLSEAEEEIVDLKTKADSMEVERDKLLNQLEQLQHEMREQSKHRVERKSEPTLDPQMKADLAQAAQDRAALEAKINKLSRKLRELGFEGDFDGDIDVDAIKKKIVGAAMPSAPESPSNQNKGINTDGVPASIIVTHDKSAVNNNDEIQKKNEMIKKLELQIQNGEKQLESIEQANRELQSSLASAVTSKEKAEERVREQEREAAQLKEEYERRMKEEVAKAVKSQPAPKAEEPPPRNEKRQKTPPPVKPTKEEPRKKTCVAIGVQTDPVKPVTPPRQYTPPPPPEQVIVYKTTVNEEKIEHERQAAEEERERERFRLEREKTAMGEHAQKQHEEDELRRRREDEQHQHEQERLTRAAEDAAAGADKAIAKAAKENAKLKQELEEKTQTESQLRSKVQQMSQELSQARGIQERLEVSLEELKKKFEELKGKLVDRGIDTSLIDDCLNDCGLDKVIAGPAVNVFDRLYHDAVKRRRKSSLAPDESFGSVHSPSQRFFRLAQPRRAVLGNTPALADVIQTAMKASSPVQQGSQYPQNSEYPQDLPGVQGAGRRPSHALVWPAGPPGNYATTCDHVHLWDSPSLDATQLFVTASGSMVYGEPYLVAGLRWLLVYSLDDDNWVEVDPEAHEQLHCASWVLIDGSPLGLSSDLLSLVGDDSAALQSTGVLKAKSTLLGMLKPQPASGTQALAQADGLALGPVGGRRVSTVENRSLSRSNSAHSQSPSRTDSRGDSRSGSQSGSRPNSHEGPGASRRAGSCSPGPNAIRAAMATQKFNGGKEHEAPSSGLVARGAGYGIGLGAEDYVHGADQGSHAQALGHGSRDRSGPHGSPAQAGPGIHGGHARASVVKDAFPCRDPRRAVAFVADEDHADLVCRGSVVIQPEDTHRRRRTLSPTSSRGFTHSPSAPLSRSAVARHRSTSPTSTREREHLAQSLGGALGSDSAGDGSRPTFPKGAMQRLADPARDAQGADGERVAAKPGRSRSPSVWTEAGKNGGWEQSSGTRMFAIEDQILLDPEPSFTLKSLSPSSTGLRSFPSEGAHAVDVIAAVSKQRRAANFPEGDVHALIITAKPGPNQSTPVLGQLTPPTVDAITGAARHRRGRTDGTPPPLNPIRDAGDLPTSSKQAALGFARPHTSPSSPALASGASLLPLQQRRSRWIGQVETERLHDLTPLTKSQALLRQPDDVDNASAAESRLRPDLKFLPNLTADTKLLQASASTRAVGGAKTTGKLLTHSNTASALSSYKDRDAARKAFLLKGVPARRADVPAASAVR